MEFGNYFYNNNYKSNHSYQFKAVAIGKEISRDISGGLYVKIGYYSQHVLYIQINK